MLCIQEELGQLGSRVATPLGHGLPAADGLEGAMGDLPGLTLMEESLDGGVAAGWMDGILGCLQPVWKIIGKATGNELKNQSQGEEQN